MIRKTLIALGTLALLIGAVSAGPGSAQAAANRTYLVVFKGVQNADGSFTMTAGLSSAVGLIQTAGGTVTADLSSQIGVFIVRSSSPLFASVLGNSALVEVVAQDYSWQAFQSLEQVIQAGAVVDLDPAGGLESLQWSMDQINAPAARTLQAGWRAVDVGVLDSGIDGSHLEFDDDGIPGGSTNVDCARGRDFVSLGPGIGNPDPCIDNQFHGTHVAGIIAAQDNGYGITGVAPNVTLVPIKVCDAPGYCYASAVVAGITYAGDAELDVINMSFFVDDDELLASTEFKCSSDPVQRAFRHSVERALSYARQRGVAPVAALGNSDIDLANPPAGNDCEVIPAEVAGVIGTMALGPALEKAGYSNYGNGQVDVGAPGGNGTTGDCTTTVLSAFPGNAYGCIQGTSMASPHAAGVAALVVSQFGVLKDGDVRLSPGTVAAYLQSTAVDLGLAGYDMCFGSGRIDAVRAVLHDTAGLYQANPFCPEYSE